MRVILLLTTLVATGMPALAGTISITIAQRAQLADGKLNVTVTVSNNGDEAAQSVVPVLRFRDQEARGTLRPALEPKTGFEETLTVTTDVGQGRWPYRLAVDYTDANQYPFQALQVQTVTAGNPPPSKVAITSLKPQGPVAGTENVDVAMKNLTGDARTLIVGLMVPDGLLELAGWGEQKLAIPVTNRTALAGSRYPVFAVAEYDDGGVHQTSIGQGVVEIIAAEGGAQQWRTPLLWVAGGLVALWLLFAAGSAIRRGSARS
jgi:hypothetical protein